MGSLARSYQTHLPAALGLILGTAIGGNGISPAAAGPIIDSAQREHERAEDQMEEIHQEMFRGLDDFYNAAKNPKSKPETLDAIRRNLSESSKKIDRIHQEAHERMNRVTESLVYQASDGKVVEEDPNKRDQKKNPGNGTSRGSGGLASGNSTTSGSDSSSSQNRAVISDTPTPFASPANEIQDPHSPQQFIFKKRGSKAPSP